MSLTQETAVDLHRLGSSPLTLATTVGAKHVNPIQNTNLYNQPRFKFMQRCNQTEHYRK